MQRIRVITLFSGYDSQCLALERLKRDYPEFDYELVAWCEYDPESKSPIERQPAIVAHNALFPQWADRNWGDITQIDESKLPDCDLVTWSFPCTDLSVAGKQAGMKEGSGTRSSLVWDAIRIFRAKKPKYLLMENVKALVSQKFIKDFYSILEALEDLGYSNFIKVLDSKQFGVPQHRERCFMVSILRTEDDPDPKYYFPEPFPLEKRLKDVLEDKVDEKYYINDKLLEKIMSENAEKCDDDDEQDEDGLSDFGSLFEEDDFE